MFGSAAGKMVSGLAMGLALGATAALVLSSRAGSTLPERRSASGPTPFEPANALISRAQGFITDVRSQFVAAIEEGRTTAAQTRLELTARFEAAKRGEDLPGKE
jgi:hypothetical protein